MDLARRLWGFLSCQRRASAGADYVLLRPSEDVNMQEMQSFFEENFGTLGITPEDLKAFANDDEVTKHLLKLIPLYRHCQVKCRMLQDYLADSCQPHTRPAAEVENQKSQRIMQALDVMILKLVVGEFSMSEDDTLEVLLNKFSTDQVALCEVQKVMGLVDMDCDQSTSILDAAAAAAAANAENCSAAAEGGIDESVLAMIPHPPQEELPVVEEVCPPTPIPPPSKPKRKKSTAVHMSV
ncbi:Cy100.1 [Cynomolgus cytomegalovirus]|uniref:Tegument protein UL51 homolog n=1 Tax=Cynomolgus macaque cytomegalovirus strain Mauritius TaxID=1690255 RepID=A0A0K1GZZ2_9BETA|nr:Cy100.1 [Cynomolgus cytomegalovirus]AKT72746.1 protein UL71 [Cynomolgus macaque cytomegalovirus strain Mauritius]AXG21798.1 protein UL71 [synthetic construct]APT39349.1 Cy100.1 [Cynomolgus cytomegalovirus]APT39462.1 Cy100.1 [Cynomolgus cytomegalovirus]APT39635.1 Cy100.1 [Cynomolgus cytomegalovirus]